MIQFSLNKPKYNNTFFKLLYKKYSANIDKIANAYKPQHVEKKTLESVIDENNLNGQTFSMILPPPNITGNLHLGHTLTCTIQDVIARYKRNKGYDVVWIPGTDHAGIATQVVVEKMLQTKHGKTRQELGRDVFINEIWKWKSKNKSSIENDLKKLGCIFDWDKEYFTLEDKQSKAVTEVFIRLFDEGKIYLQESLISWSCILESAISDIEIENYEIDGPTEIYVPGYQKNIKFGLITDIAYKFQDSNEEIIVSTTRPETILGDVAVAVHPSDVRYTSYRNSNKTLWHPYRKCEIPLVFDDYVDPEFGSGAVKVTPAHDKNDFELAKRHNLPVNVPVFNNKGMILPNFEGFSDLPRFTAREEILASLKKLNLLRGIRAHKMVLPICSRSKDIIEYLIRPQWFIDCKEMSRSALNAVQNEDLKIYPISKVKEWNRWLSDCRDWCISRQLWWGHRIPAYEVEYETKKLWIAARSRNELNEKILMEFPKCDLSLIQIRQDPDVLDTWFSSALLPFSSLGWPESNQVLNKYYPLNLMETGHDILFFWVARMVMLGYKMTGKLPFEKILLHGIISDSEGRKMSKSLGNVITPDEVIFGISTEQMEKKTETSLKEGFLSKEEFERSLKSKQKAFPNGIPECGVDALRFTLCSSNIQNHFISFDISECHTNRIFFNKIWQATRFYIQSIDNINLKFDDEFDLKNLHIMDRWILSRLAHTIEIVENGIENYSFHSSTSELKNFFYYTLCDIYLETIKPGIKSNDFQLKENHCKILGICLSIGLKNLSYFTPFLSQELLKYLPLPENLNYKKLRDINLENKLTKIIDISSSIRQLKSQNMITNKFAPKIILYSKLDELKDFKEIFQILTRTNKFQIVNDVQKFENYKFFAKSTAGHECSFGILIEDNVTNAEKLSKIIDVNVKKLEKLQKEYDKLLVTVSNPGYQKLAAEKIKEKHIEKLHELKTEIENITQLK